MQGRGRGNETEPRKARPVGCAGGSEGGEGMGDQPHQERARRQGDVPSGSGSRQIGRSFGMFSVFLFFFIF